MHFPGSFFHAFFETEGQYRPGFTGSSDSFSEPDASLYNVQIFCYDKAVIRKKAI